MPRHLSLLKLTVKKFCHSQLLPLHWDWSFQISFLVVNSWRQILSFPYWITLRENFKANTFTILEIHLFLASNCTLICLSLFCLLKKGFTLLFMYVYVFVPLCVPRHLEYLGSQSAGSHIAGLRSCYEPPKEHCEPTSGPLTEKQVLTTSESSPSSNGDFLH